jgi:hypothetical protein
MHDEVRIVNIKNGHVLGVPAVPPCHNFEEFQFREQ